MQHALMHYKCLLTTLKIAILQIMNTLVLQIMFPQFFRRNFINKLGLSLE